MPTQKKAWAIFDKEDRMVVFMGNGYEFQAAIFPTRKEAREFRNRNSYLAKYWVIKRIAV